jgi:hypothetical protein
MIKIELIYCFSSQSKLMIFYTIVSVDVANTVILINNLKKTDDIPLKLITVFCQIFRKKSYLFIRDF